MSLLDPTQNPHKSRNIRRVIDRLPSVQDKSLCGTIGGYKSYLLGNSNFSVV